jgi:hypothetical protein
MGVSAVAPWDVVDIVTSLRSDRQETPVFTAGVEFFGGVTVPAGGPWAVRVEYGYQRISYGVDSFLGRTELEVSTHLPSVALLWTPLSGDQYLFRCGGGAGYHWGSLDRHERGSDARWTAHGPGFVLLVEGATGLGDNLFAYLGASLRWEALGDLQNNGGTSPAGVALPGPLKLSMGAAGVRLGLAYMITR